MISVALLRWCKPKNVLVVMRPSDDLARVVAIVRQSNVSGAKVLVVQLPGETGNTGGVCNPYQFSPPVISNGKTSDRGAGTRESALWIDLTSRALVLRISSFDEIPSLARAANADRVVLTAIKASSGFKERTREDQMLRASGVPVLIIGSLARLDESPVPFRRIAMAISHEGEIEPYWTFASCLAQQHQASLSILHICHDSPDCDGSPLTIASRIPIESLRSRGLLFPMEIVVRAGDPAEVILGFERQRSPDLIVMGGPEQSAQRSGTNPDLLDRILAEARCPLMILNGLPASTAASPSPHSIFSLTPGFSNEFVSSNAEK